MRFTPVTVRSRISSRTTTAYLPYQSNKWTATPGEVFAEIEAHNDKRLARVPVLELIKRFTEEKERRSRLGHDGAVLALEYETGKTFLDDVFNDDGGKKVVIDHAEPTSPDKYFSADIILTSSSDDIEAFSRKAISEPNFLIRATEDAGEPLYAAKLGDTGPVVLMSLEQSGQFYPIAAVWTVSGFRAVEFDR